MLHFPWTYPPIGNSVYTDLGPPAETTFQIAGATFVVTPTKETGLHSGRTRYRVVCASCAEVPGRDLGGYGGVDGLIHRGTTSPPAMIGSHLADFHGWDRRTPHGWVWWRGADGITRLNDLERVGHPADTGPNPADFACKVCHNLPDEEGILHHGKGCYVLSSDGGGDHEVFVPVPAPKVAPAPDLAEAKRRLPLPEPLDEWEGKREVARALIDRGVVIGMHAALEWATGTPVTAIDLSRLHELIGDLAFASGKR